MRRVIARTARITARGFSSTPTTLALNIDNIVDKKYETSTLSEIAAAPISALQGLADSADATGEQLKLTSVHDLGTNKHVAWAQALVALAPYEIAEHRAATSSLNVNLALDKAHEGKTLKEIIALPPSALQGVAEHADEAWAALGVKSIGDMGTWKFAAAAHAIATLAECEASDVSQHK